MNQTLSFLHRGSLKITRRTVPLSLSTEMRIRTHRKSINFVRMKQEKSFAIMKFESREERIQNESFR